MMMDVQCSQCSTEYEFEKERIPVEGLSVKCSQCGSVFKVFRDDQSPEGVWKVRQQNGNLFEFRELTTLQRWIVERKVDRQDEISKTSKNWKRLGDIAELATFFQVVEKAQGSDATLPTYSPPDGSDLGSFSSQPTVRTAIPANMGQEVAPAPFIVGSAPVAQTPPVQYAPVLTPQPAPQPAPAPAPGSQHSPDPVDD